MKKIMLILSAIMMVANVSAEPKSIEPFDQINVEVPARVRVVQGEEYGIQVISADSNSTRNLKYSVVDGVLRIKTESSDMMEASPRNMVITIITPADNAKVTTGDDMAKLVLKKRNR